MATYIVCDFSLDQSQEYICQIFKGYKTIFLAIPDLSTFEPRRETIENSILVFSDVINYNDSLIL